MLCFFATQKRFNAYAIYTQRRNAFEIVFRWFLNCMPPQTGLTKYASNVRWVFWESNKEHTSPSSVSRQHFMRFTLADFCVSWTTYNHAHAFSFNQKQCQNSGFFHTHTENRYSPSNWAATGTGTTFRKFLQPCFAQYPTFRRCLMAAYTALRDTVAFSPRAERFALALQRVDVAKEFR